MHDTREALVPLVLCAFLLYAPTPLRAEETPETLGSRYKMERMPDSKTKADTGYFLLWPDDRMTSNTVLRILSRSGVEAGYEVLWAADGEPLKVLFDCSSHDSTYYVYAGQKSVKPSAWTPKGGLILETRCRQEGEPTESASIKRICHSSSPVLGRSMVPNIFLGIHPHGPTEDLVSIFKGFFSVERAGRYGFATISEDASCIFIDGHAVAQWPGWHSCHGGRRGEHEGEVTLTAGAHRIEYFNVKKGPGYVVEAAWKPPGRERFELIPASAFVPVADFRISAYEAAPSDKPAARFSWEIEGHFTIDVATLVHVKFKALSEGQRYVWSFDDGAQEHGPVVEHVFLSPGMRAVKLEMQCKGQPSAVSEKVHVHPLWTQERDQPRHLFKEERRRLAREDLASAPVADLVNVYRIAVDEEDLPMVRKYATLCLGREKDFDAEHTGVFCEIAMFVQRADMQEYGMAQQAFRVVLRSPLFTREQKAWALLHLAGLLIHCVGETEEARDLLSKIETDKLSDSDKRLKRIYEADALLAAGHPDSARDVYVSIGTSYAPGDTERALVRRGRLEAARDYLRRGEFDDAERMVRWIEWEAPEQRMGTETGLIMIRVCMGRKEFEKALILSRKLLPLAETDICRSELLSAVVEICLATNRDKDAVNVYGQLLKEHPYSEAAALAKEKWGDKIKSYNK